MSGVIGSYVGAASKTGVVGNMTISGDLVPSTPMSHRNMIINGGMQVFQRATGATTGNGYKTVDRWAVQDSTGGQLTSQKHTMSTAEINTTGHRTAWQLNCTTADGSIAASDYAYFWQHIEAQNCQHLQWGTGNAKTVTLSFWVKSNKTGTYCAGLRKIDTTQYHIFDEYTINAADTWEKKTITFTPTAGSTSLITGSGGIIDNDNGQGIQVHFGLTWGTTYGSGTPQTWSASSAYYASTNQVNWYDSTSNNLYLTGVQLEVGSNATPFEHRSYGDEVARCQRYYCGYDSTWTRLQQGLLETNSVDSGECFAMVWNPVQLRSDSPTFTAVSLKNGSGTNLNNTNFGPFVTTGAQNVFPIQKKTDNVTTNQTMINVYFTLDDEL